MANVWKPVYLDYAASAPLRPEALQAMADYEAQPWAGANPNSLHTAGRMAAQALDRARGELAGLVGSGLRPSNVVFTSGGTESNNLAVLGMAQAARERDARRVRVLLSAIEHDSVLDLAPVLRAQGFAVDLAPVRADGRVHAEDLRELLGADVALVSVMVANNETGVVQPVEELAREAHAAGALFHSDAVQAFGRIPLKLEGVDAVSVAAHKIGGPVGVGALLLRERVPLRAQAYGGGQEGGRRSGTQDVRGALAFVAAARAVCADLVTTRELVAGRARDLYARVCAPGTHIVPTAGVEVGADRLPGMVSVLTQGVESETTVLKLDALGYEVSAGSACSSGSLDPSHVLTAMGIPRDLAFGSLRVSFDERVEPAQLAAFGDALVRLVAEERC